MNFFAKMKKSSESFYKQNKVMVGIDDKNLTNFINRFFVPELASSLFDNAVKTLCAQAQARALPEQH